MTAPRHPGPVLITGAAGTLGCKLRHHLDGRVELRLLDRDPRGDPAVTAADLAVWSDDWAGLFAGAGTVVHFAADPEAFKPWPDLVGPNVDALIHAYQAAARGGVRRFVFASSNHVMGGYQDDTGVSLGADTPSRPGLRYRAGGAPRDSSAYAAAKLFGERLGACYADSHGLETVAVRIGWVWRGGPNEPGNLPPERGEWFRLMWLSDPDFLHLMDRCLAAELPRRFVVVNGMSANAGMPWDLGPGRALGYEPRDDVTRLTTPWRPSSDGTWVPPSGPVIDLTLPLRRGVRGFDWETAATVERDGWNARTLHLYSHAGTHMDAPAHFDAGPGTVDQIPLDRCCGTPRVVHLPGTRPRELLTPGHLGPVADTFRPGEVLLLATGWGRHADDPAVYRDGLPRVGEELARWCVDRGVKLLGVEPPSVADVNNRDELTRVHHILLGGGVVIVEGLTNLDRVRDGVGWFVAAPLKVEGGDGCPCRAFVVLPGSDAGPRP